MEFSYQVFKNQEIVNLRNYLNLKENALQEYELQLNRTQRDLEEWRNSFESADNELRKWREKCDELERNHRGNIEELKAKMENTRRQLIVSFL